MFSLFFGDVFSILTTTAILGMLTLIAITISKRDQIQRWGRLILLFVVVGTAISGLSAVRDAYMTAQAVFSVSSLQSTICSLAGSLIFLTALLALFIRNQTFRKLGFQLISILFLVQVLVIEVSRIAAI